jgi:two-component system cell cycle sensor histidine kinase/response regulator CckA
VTARLRALILEDRPTDAELVVMELRRQGFDPDWTRVETEEEFLAALDEDYDVVLSDFSLPGFDALQALAHVRRRALTIPVIVITGAVGEETAAQCIREGAADYLLKDRLARLGLAVSQALERRRLEDQLRHSQKMEAVGKLAGGVAHDFNNLLQALVSQTQMLRSHHSDPDQLGAITTEIEQLVRRGAGLTRQLLIFSRRETTQLVGLNLNEIIRDQTALLRRLVRANVGLDLQLFSDDLPVVGDCGQLEQILMNLVVNASDVLPDGGRVTIRSGCQMNGDPWFSVEDDGPGVPEELRTRIFEPFFTTKESSRGTGLGLSVVHGIITQHGGRVFVDDRPGGGSVFTVVLPRAAGHEDSRVHAVAAAQADPAGGSHERVLVVEDEDAAREGLADLLLALDYDVVAVGSAEEVDTLPDAPAFDLLLTDLMLPGAQGTELANVAHQRWPDVRVVLMSGYNREDVVRRGVGSGIVRFLQKPFDMRTLAAELRAALDDPENGARSRAVPT